MGYEICPLVWALCKYVMIFGMDIFRLYIYICRPTIECRIFGVTITKLCIRMHPIIPYSSDNKALTLCTVLNASKACHISIVFEGSLLRLYFKRRECNNELFIPHLDEFCVWHLPYSFCFIYLTHVDLFHLASGIHIHTCLSPAQRSWNRSVLKSVCPSVHPSTDTTQLPLSRVQSFSNRGQTW